MSALEKPVRPLAMAYLVVVTLVGAGLIVFGFLLSRVPGIPAVVDRSYTGFVLWLLSALVRPFDLLSPEVAER